MSGPTNYFKAYVRPFDANGEYAADWVEVTDDVDWDSVGKIAQQLDNTEYDVGILRNASVSVVLRNEAGLYSDIGEPRTIFQYKRANSLFRITWQIEDGPWCGDMICGQAYLSEEVDVFLGMITDEDVKLNVADGSIKLTALGLESILNQVETLSGILGAAAQPRVESVIGALLLQEAVLEVLETPGAVAFGQELDDLQCAVDPDVTDDSGFDNRPVQQVLNELLQAGNAVIVVEGSALTVKPRTPGSTVVATFRGPGTVDGIENIIELKEIRSGLARVINSMLVEHSGVKTAYQNADSINRYGLRTKSLTLDFIGDAGDRGDVASSFLTEFSSPKRELDLTVALNYPNLEIALLDRVALDYPLIYYPQPGVALPICGVAVCGSATLPAAKWDFTVDTSTNWKVMRRSVKIQDGTISLGLREI